MRVISVTVLAIAILASGLVSHFSPRATASSTAGATIDPYALHATIDLTSMPELRTADPF